MATISIWVSILALFSNKHSLPLFKITRSTTALQEAESKNGTCRRKYSCQKLQIQVVNEEYAYESTPSPAMHWVTASVHAEMCVCEAECRSLKA